MRPFFPLIVILLLGCVTQNKPNPLKSEYGQIHKVNDKIVFNLGEDSCFLSKTGEDSLNFRFFSIHDDENTSTNVFHSIKKSLNGAILMELQQSGDRLLSYKSKGKKYQVDPNRIFSIVGLNASLNVYNSSYPSIVKDSLISFSKKLLKAVLPSKPDQYMVAIHNNSDGNFSVNTYKGSRDAAQCYINTVSDADNFIIVTKEEDYQYFKNKQINVVLQSPDAKDDGSLSIYSQKNNIPYINIEVQDGQNEIQRSYILMVYEYLKNK